MRWPVWILLLILALWIFLGLYFWRDNPFTRANSGSDDPCVVAWELSDIGVKSNATINFAKSSAKMEKLDSGLSEAINSISDYLKKNKNKSITIIGYHDLTESYEPSLYDLSLARANQVKEIITNKGVSASQLHVFPKQYKDNDDSRCLQGNRLNRGVSFEMGKVTK